MVRLTSMLALAAALLVGNAAALAHGQPQPTAMQLRKDARSAPAPTAAPALVQRDPVEVHKRYGSSYNAFPSYVPGGGSPSSPTNLAPIIGGAVGGVVILVGVGLIVFFCLRRRNRQRRADAIKMQAPYAAPYNPPYAAGPGGAGAGLAAERSIEQQPMLNPSQRMPSPAPPYESASAYEPSRDSYVSGPSTGAPYSPPGSPPLDHTRPYASYSDFKPPMAKPGAPHPSQYQHGSPRMDPRTSYGAYQGPQSPPLAQLDDTATGKGRHEPRTAYGGYQSPPVAQLDDTTYGRGRHEADTSYGGYHSPPLAQLDDTGRARNEPSTSYGGQSPPRRKPLGQVYEMSSSSPAAERAGAQGGRWQAGRGGPRDDANELA